MKATLPRLALLAGLALSSGCYKATFVEPATAAGEHHEEWTDFFVFGLVGEEKVDARSFCKGEVAMVRTGGNAGTGIVSVLTLGIYTPRKVYVTCAAGGPSTVASSSEVSR